MQRPILKSYQLEVFLRALASLIFKKIQGYGVWYAKEYVIIDTGHHLTFHPTDMKKDCLLGVFRPTREFFTPMETSPCIAGDELQMLTYA